MLAEAEPTSSWVTTSPLAWLHGIVATTHITLANGVFAAHRATNLLHNKISVGPLAFGFAVGRKMNRMGLTTCSKRR